MPIGLANIWGKKASHCRDYNAAICFTAVILAKKSATDINVYKLEESSLTRVAPCGMDDFGDPISEAAAAYGLCAVL
jgi:hypothetical protein